MACAETSAPGDLVRCLTNLDDEGQRRRLIERWLPLCDADELLTLLRAEAERFFAADPHVGLRLAEAILDAANLANRPDHRAFGLMAKADMLRPLGRYEESVMHYEEARRLFQEQGNTVGWARTFTGWVISSHFLGRGADALAAMEPAYDILARNEEWIRAAGLRLNMAYVCYSLGRYDQAYELYDQTQRIYESIGQTVEERAARAKMNKAMILTLRGEFKSALALHEEARQVSVRLGMTFQVLRHTLYIADVYAGQGRYTQALRLYGDTLEVLERNEYHLDATWAALNMVECYLKLNRYEEALALAEETVARSERCGTPTETAKARFACAQVYARLGESGRALALLGEAAKQLADTGLTSHVGIALLLRAGLHLTDGQWSAALEDAEQARELFVDRRLVVRQAQADIACARALLGLGRDGDAAVRAEWALKATEERDAHWLAHESRHILASVARRRDDLEGALAEYQAAISSIDQVQSRLATELRSNFLADKLQVYHDAIDCCLRLTRPELAFDFLERAKSRALVDYLASNLDVRIRVRDDAGEALADELARLREEHHWFYNRLYGPRLAHSAQPGSGPIGAETLSDAESEFLHAAIRDRERSISRILERLALHQASGREDLAPPPTGQRLPLPEVDADTVLLEYYVRDDTAAVFVLTSGQLTVVPLTTRLADLQRKLDAWKLNLEATAQSIIAGEGVGAHARHAQSVLRSLYESLLRPVASYLVGRQRLIVIPYGLTHAVPFHALHDGQRYLVETLEISMCPSSSLLRLCAKRPRRGAASALVIAHSDNGQLPYVYEEARAVATLLPGECLVDEHATRDAIRQAAPAYGVLHLAAHGEARIDNPTFAHLKLADGQLSMVDVFNLDLDGALVTLSACETGRTIVTGGDELIGLSRGFLFAGAATLVQSLWRVEDGSTARLMANFYQALQRGLPRVAALREAQLTLLGDSYGVHPYLWAAFQLIGNGDRA